MTFAPSFPFAPGTSERSIEIPWALARYNSGERILEVGCSFAYDNPEYVERLKALPVRELHGIDVSSVAAPDFIKRTADIRESGYPPDFFDMVLCISTIEHIGRDNTRHYSPIAEVANDDEPDRTALLEMLRITRPGGTVIVTVPFGKLVDYGWFLNYDAANIARLFRGIALRASDYFRYSPAGWIACRAEELADARYGDNGAPAAAGLACFEIVKTDSE